MDPFFDRFWFFFFFFFFFPSFQLNDRLLLVLSEIIFSPRSPHPIVTLSFRGDTAASQSRVFLSPVLPLSRPWAVGMYSIYVPPSAMMYGVFHR